jgi:hypothetical protein
VRVHAAALAAHTAGARSAMDSIVDVMRGDARGAGVDVVRRAHLKI